MKSIDLNIFKSIDFHLAGDRRVFIVEPTNILAHLLRGEQSSLKI